MYIHTTLLAISIRVSRFGGDSRSDNSRFRFAQGSRYEQETAGKYVYIRRSRGDLHERRTVKYDLHPVFYILLGYSVYRSSRAHSGQVAMNTVYPTAV